MHSFSDQKNRQGQPTREIGFFDPLIEESSPFVIITDNGPAKPDQRSISTIPAPPDGEIIHAKREEFIVHDVNGYPELAMLRCRAHALPPSLLDLPPELRGCSAMFIAGFTHVPFRVNGCTPEEIREYTRGQAASAGVEYH